LSWSSSIPSVEMPPSFMATKLRRRKRCLDPDWRKITESGTNLRLRGQYRSFGAGSLPVAATSLRPFQPYHSSYGLFILVEGFHHGLAARADPPPVADHRCPTKQGWLNGERVKPAHVLRRIDTAHMDWTIAITRHGLSFAPFG